MYECKCCDYNTKLKGNYDKHKLTKRHIKKFKYNKYCEICKKDYSTVGNYKMHYEREHINNNNQNNKINKNNEIKEIKDMIISLDNKITKNINENKEVNKEENKEENKELIREVNKELNKEVNKNINRVSLLIKYLTSNYKPLGQLNDDEIEKINELEKINNELLKLIVYE